MRYETTDAGEAFEDVYDSRSSNYYERAYQQMLVMFRDGLSVEDAKWNFNLPVAKPPLTPIQLETQLLFQYIIKHFDSILDMLLRRGLIQLCSAVAPCPRVKEETLRRLLHQMQF
ncbi:MAG: hypothetical protein H0X02_11955 [Nitrosomonas sp.]|nr:hypothetical protein [Nitrosomonas sp.]